MISSFLSPTQTWQLLGWTMIFFLAAGTVVFLLGGTFRVALRRASPTARYATSLGTFAVLAVLPIAIAGYLATNSLTNPTRQRGELTTKHTNDTKELLNAEVAKSAKAAEKPIVGATERTEGTEKIDLEQLPAASMHNTLNIELLLHRSATYLPWLWFVGTPLTFLLLATGLIGAERLRKTCNVLDDGPIRTACDELQRSLRIGRCVGVAVCQRLATPILVGIVKPLILLPPAALNGWTTEELEMVLVHELTHVRRWDNAVNLAQRIVESLLFFHPAVWIVSGWVRRDREDCCDAVVVRHTARPQAYAELLLALASSEPRLATSAALARHPVAHRIRRILKLEDETMLVTRKGFTIGVCAVITALILAFALPTTDAEEASRKRERPEVSREAERVADEREVKTTNQTNNTYKEQFSPAAITGSKGLGTNFPNLPLDDADRQRIVEDLKSQGFDARLVKTTDADGKSEQILMVSIPQDMQGAINWEGHPDGLRARVVLFDKSGRAVETPLREQVTYEQQESREPERLEIATTQHPEQTTNQSDDADVETIREWFKATNSNPLRRAEYAVPAGYASEMEAAFEGLQSDPYGPRASFEWQWVEKGTAVSVGAPEQAHDKWFRPLFARMAKHASLFPSLEVQRAADIAYKLLGVELEKLTRENLERVKAKGYKGGLRVTGSNQKFGIGADDLLVGLHVWPTESLDQVTDILARDDLDQLSPLKFYVVRAAGLSPDSVITGRIQVDLDAWRAMREPALKQLVALEKQIQNELAEKENRRDVIPAAERAMHNAEITQLREILQSIGQKIASRTPREDVTTATGATPLLYDGKTFDEWRNLWKTELKIEKRIECIKALAAFGRAGKGKEAAEAILDVAAEYDFGKGEGSSATDLKSAISEVLTGPEGIAAEHWLPLYIERLKSNLDQWSAFADWVLADVSGKNVLEHLKQIAADESLPAKPRNAALAGMSLQPEVADDTEAVALVREGLLRDPPVMEILHKLQFDRMDLFPQQVEPLLDREKSVRNQALQLLQSRMHPMRGGPVLDELLKLIDDPSRAADHAYAINAIGQLGFFFNNDPAMGKRKQEVTRRLAKILVDGDEELLSVTLMSMSSIGGESADQLVETGLKNLGDKISDERREQLKKAADEVEQWTGGDGGMGRGGYGAEMGGGGAF